MKGIQHKARTNFKGKAVYQHRKHNGDELSRSMSKAAKLKARRRRIGKRSKQANR